MVRKLFRFRVCNTLRHIKLYKLAGYHQVACLAFYYIVLFFRSVAEISEIDFRSFLLHLFMRLNALVARLRHLFMQRFFLTPFFLSLSLFSSLPVSLLLVFWSFKWILAIVNCSVFAVCALRATLHWVRVLQACHVMCYTLRKAWQHI